MIKKRDSCHNCIFNHAVCPNCGKEAHTAAEVERLFGLRIMEDGTKRVQSWCKDCR